MESIKYLRKEKGISQQKLADKLGVSRSTIAMWETGQSQPDNDMLKKLSEIFSVSIDYLLGQSLTHYENKNGIKVPVLGYVAAGIPIEAIENIIDYEELDPKQFDSTHKYFALKIKGDSMTPRIQDGDVVIVRQQPDIENGDVAIVCINGDEATCKQVKKHPEGISLIPFNNAYEVKFYTKSETESLPITILGKVVELRGKF
ncbi:MAG: helix-turn-helix domain-containing protein [Clostridia bacterium]|nr:helix-turn-helix domain-containing protein [Clostridia bacterium]